MHRTWAQILALPLGSQVILDASLALVGPQRPRLENGDVCQMQGSRLGCLIGLLRNQNLRKVQVWTLPQGEKLAGPKCELGVAGAVSWIKPPRTGPATTQGLGVDFGRC